MISDKFLKFVAGQLGGYYDLGLHLGVSDEFIEQQENNFPKNTITVTTKVLIRWRNISKESPNVANMMGELVSSLEDIHKKNVAEVVRRGECLIEPCHC